MSDSLWLRPQQPTETLAGRPDVRWFHRRMPGYHPTPAHWLTGEAALGGLAPVVLKHEQDRFGLPSFKPLGASWAVYRLLCRRLGEDLEDQWTNIDELRALVRERVGGLTLVTATDGNHGRGVARVANLLGLAAHIYVPRGTADARIDAIRGEGAVLDIVAGDYDATVAAAAQTASEDRVIISDTSWEGYTTIPADIAQGYSTLFREASTVSREFGAVLVPTGVGALAAAAVAHFSGTSTRVILVEPVGADCVTRSLKTGSPVTVPGPHRSTMAGLNCGTVSAIAWPLIRDHAAASVVIEDRDAFTAMRMAAGRGIVLGETGAAALGALLRLTEDLDGDALTALGLTGTAPILVLGTEAATDPENYKVVVGTSAARVGASAAGRNGELPTPVMSS